MKESKIVCIGSILLGLSCGIFAILIEWKTLIYAEYIVLNFFPYLHGHRAFVENILIGVFASGFLLIYTSYMHYKAEYERLVREVVIAYSISYLKVSSYRAKGFTYDRMLSLKKELLDIQNDVIEFSRCFSPFRSNSEKNEKIYEILHIIQEFQFAVIEIDVWEDGGWEKRDRSKAKERAEQLCRSKLEEVYIKAKEITKWINETMGYRI